MDGLPYVSNFPPLLVAPGKPILALVLLATLLVVWVCTDGLDMLQKCGLTRNALLMYVSIPVVSTLFTYGHIWAALYMTFYPLKYIGCLQIPDTNAGCGWQGIVPSKAEKMARTSVKLMTEKLLTTREIFERIDPEMVAEELDPIIHNNIAEIIDNIAQAEHPILWNKVPNFQKKELVQTARDQAPETIRILMDDVRENIEEVFDLTTMVVNSLVGDPDLQCGMFIECGYDELVFIRNFGAYMGFIVGVFQMTLWIFWSAGWMLPTFGLVVGMLSNWMALKMIFEPVVPYRICGLGCLEIQGRFLKRQKEVSEVYARIVASKMLSAKNIIPAIIAGPFSDALFELVSEHIDKACNACADRTTTVSMIRRVQGGEKFARCKKMVSASLIESLPDTMSHVEKYFDSAMDLENLLKEKMTAMHPHDFERLLHPVFEEDEWKLVLMGGVLGVFVGCMQWKVLGS